MGVSQPLDEFPVVRRKQFLLVRGADDEVDQFAQRADLLARARAREQKLDGEAMARGIFGIGLGFAQDTERGARRVEQWHGRRRQVSYWVG